MQLPTKFEDQIKKSLSDKVADIYPSEDMYFKIKRELHEGKKRKGI